MQVDFRTQSYGDEATSLAAVEAGQAPAEEEHVYGTVTLRRDDGEAVDVTDDLLFLMPDLCGDAPAKLERTGKAAVTIVDYPNTVRLVRDGDEVHVTDQLGADLRVPYGELLPALRACGLRFAAYLEKLSPLQEGVDWSARKIRDVLTPGGVG